MATPNSKAKARRSRNSSTHAGKSAPAGLALVDAIETERRRLQKAHSVLGCIAVAFDSGEGVTPCEIDFADAIDAARFLVDDAIVGLDSVTLRSRAEE